MKCKICCNDRNNQLFYVKEMMFGTKEEFSYLQCSECGSLQLVDKPQNMSKFYKPGYYSVDNRLHLNMPKGLTQKIKRFLVNRRNYYAVFQKGAFGKILYKIIPNPELFSLSKITLSKETSILDVGCGIGAHLFFLKELGFRNILGIDPFNEKEIIHENGLRISKESISEVSSRWDIITYHHSFEHVESPINELLRVHELLNETGICIIRTPTVDSYAWKYYKENWVQIDAPRHYFIYSLEGIKKIAVQTGFELFNFYYDSEAFQFWGSEQYKTGISLVGQSSYYINPNKSNFSIKEIKDFQKRANRLNQENYGDQVVCYLRKK